MSELSKILQTAKKILEGAGRKGMHVKDIAEAAVSMNENMGLSSEEFQRKVGCALAANLKLKSTKPTFASVNWDSGPRKGKSRQGWYRLKAIRQVPLPEPVPPQVSTSFLGKAGEYAVMSELLFWEYNVSQMTVDDGIDLVASKNNKFFFIQVKTSTKQNDGKYNFTISKSSFMKYQGQNVYYVFVLRHIWNNEYIILSGTLLDSFIRTGILQNTQALSIRIAVNEKRTEYVLNGKTDVKYYLGRFGEIII